MALPDATHKRADILATADTGELFALDVTFTSPLDDSAGPLAPLHRAATAKAGRYHTTLGGTLPGDVRFVPLTYLATRPHLHSAGLTLLHRVVRGMAARQCPPDSGLWGLHFAQATLDATMALAYRIQVDSWRHLSSCLPP